MAAIEVLAKMDISTAKVLIVLIVIAKVAALRATAKKVTRQVAIVLAAIVLAAIVPIVIVMVAIFRTKTAQINLDRISLTNKSRILSMTEILTNKFDSMPLKNEEQLRQGELLLVKNSF